MGWKYPVQWFFTRTSQLQFICHCSLPSQGAPGTGKQIRRGNSILRRALSPSKTAQCTKGVLRGSRDGRKERREMDCQGGQLGVECVSEKYLQVNVLERAWNVRTRLPGTRHLPAMWSLASPFISLCLSFAICKIGIKLPLTAHRLVEG